MCDKQEVAVVWYPYLGSGYNLGSANNEIQNIYSNKDPQWNTPDHLKVQKQQELAQLPLMGNDKMPRQK